MKTVIEITSPIKNPAPDGRKAGSDWRSKKEFAPGLYLLQSDTRTEEILPGRMREHTRYEIYRANQPISMTVEQDLFQEFQNSGEVKDIDTLPVTEGAADIALKMSGMSQWRIAAAFQEIIRQGFVNLKDIAELDTDN